MNQDVLRRAIRRTTDSLLGKAAPLEATNYVPALPVVDWIQSQFYIPETKAPMQLHPYQQAMLTEALRTDDNGLLLYDLVLWSDIKKSAKSTIAAAVVLYRAIYTEHGRFRIVANDQKQAASRVFEAITTCLRLNKELGAKFRQNRYLLAGDNNARIEAVPVDPKGEAGGGDDMTEFTELHEADSKASQKMWSETTLSPLKFGKSQRWIDTYAGHSGESPVLEPLYQSIVREGLRLRLPNAPADLEVYANGRSLALWNTMPRLSWQTPAYYESEAKALLPNEFLRMHRNQWVSSGQSFIPIEWWDACGMGHLPELDSYREIVVALDAAVDNDCFGIVGLSRTEDKTILRLARKWTPPPNGKLVFTDFADPRNPEYPEGAIRQLADQYNVIAFVYDPYQLESFCSNLRFQGIGMFEPFSQGAARLTSDKMLYDCIRDRRIIHDGNPDMREHLLNANSTAEDKDTLRIVKRAQHLKIDLAVALSMANAAAYKWLPD